MSFEVNWTLIASGCVLAPPLPRPLYPFSPPGHGNSHQLERSPSYASNTSPIHKTPARKFNKYIMSGFVLNLRSIVIIYLARELGFLLFDQVEQEKPV